MRDWLTKEGAKKLLWINKGGTELQEESVPCRFNELGMFGLG
jgi:hypothetical protein